MSQFPLVRIYSLINSKVAKNMTDKNLIHIASLDWMDALANSWGMYLADGGWRSLRESWETSQDNFNGRRKKPRPAAPTASELMHAARRDFQTFMSASSTTEPVGRALAARRDASLTSLGNGGSSSSASVRLC